MEPIGGGLNEFSSESLIGMHRGAGNAPKSPARPAHGGSGVLQAMEAVPVTMGKRFAEYDDELVAAREKEGLTLIEISAMRTEVAAWHTGLNGSTFPSARTVKLGSLRTALRSLAVELRPGELALKNAAFGQVDPTSDSAPLFVWANVSQAKASDWGPNGKSIIRLPMSSQLRGFESREGQKLYVKPVRLGGRPVAVVAKTRMVVSFNNSNNKAIADEKERVGK